MNDNAIKDLLKKHYIAPLQKLGWDEEKTEQAWLLMQNSAGFLISVAAIQEAIEISQREAKVKIKWLEHQLLNT